MSYQEESPIETTLGFIPIWKDTDPRRITAELVSLYKETNRKPDTYHFVVDNGRLLDTETGRPILDFILPGIEYRIAEDLQNWTNQNETGLAFWISPALPGKYPCAKVIIHRIGYTLDGRKVLLNSAILFNAQLNHSEELRKKLFTTEDSEKNVFAILNWIEEISKQKSKKTNGSPKIRQQAKYFTQRIILGISPNSIVEEMRQTGFLGQSSISCPTKTKNPSFSEYTLRHSNVVNHEGGKFVKNCGNCGAPINAVISAGYVCPNCGGVYLGC